MKYTINNNIEVLDYVQIRESVGWNKIPDLLVQKAINNSMFNVSIFDNNKCIGVGRIVGDNALKGMLTDIMVLPEYQGKGIGKTIVTTLINQLNNMVEDGECFQLEASPTSNNREFYIKCGMKYKPENQDGVYLWIRK